MTLDTIIAATDEVVDDPLAPPAPTHRPRARPDPVRLATAATLLVLLAGWWLASHLGLVSPVFLPTPEAVARQFVLVARDGFVDATLLQHLGASLGRVAVALLAAGLTAIPVGLAIGLSPIARGIFDPLIEFYRPIPPLAYLSLIIIWFGIGELAKIILIYLAVFAPVAIATAAGVKGVPRDWWCCRTPCRRSSPACASGSASAGRRWSPPSWSRRPAGSVSWSSRPPTSW